MENAKKEAYSGFFFLNRAQCCELAGAGGERESGQGRERN